MSVRNAALIAGLAASLLLHAPRSRADTDDPALEKAAHVIAVGTCSGCHGPAGHSQLPKFPVLSGQHATYLSAQLLAFKSRSRGDADAVGYMWGMAEPLSDELIAALAAYYARQTPRAGPVGDAAMIARGKTLYLTGDPSQGVPACAICHGADARGTDSYPRLAGQHAQYLLKQLRAFQSNLRNVAVMHGVAQTLHGDDMKAVALYLQSAGP